MRLEQDFVVFGHRGAKGYYPENTLASFEAALSLGVSWLELDVHLSRDERMMVIHDSTVDRTTNGRGRVSDLSFAELKKLDAGSGEAIPTLEEVLERLEGRAGINIELKGARTAAPVAATLRERVERGETSWDRFLISSFNHKELAAFSKLAPDARIAPLLYGLPYDNARTAEAMGAFSLHLSKEFIDAEIVEDAHARGLRVFVYTINDPEELPGLRTLNVDGIFSDLPDLLLAAVKKGVPRSGVN